MKKQSNYVVIVTICIMGIVSARELPSDPLSTSSTVLRDKPIPQLSKDMWWTTETRQVVTTGTKYTTASSPPLYAERVLTHRWTVEGQEEIGGKKCWVLVVREAGPRTPPEAEFVSIGEKKARSEKDVTKLWLAVDNGALVKLTALVDHSKWEIGGKVDKNNRTYSGKDAVINAWFAHQVPLDVPLLPAKWTEYGTGVEYDVLGGKVTQTICPFTPAKSGGTKAMVVTLQHATHGIRTMLWDNECPWWREWRCVYKNGRIRHLWYARTVDWKGRKKARKAEEAGKAKKAGVKGAGNRR